jgi:hypothetical protein
MATELVIEKSHVEWKPGFRGRPGRRGPILSVAYCGRSFRPSTPLEAAQGFLWSIASRQSPWPSRSTIKLSSVL